VAAGSRIPVGAAGSRNLGSPSVGHSRNLAWVAGSKIPVGAAGSRNLVGAAGSRSLNI